ncbi:MAG: hypothetical protein BGN92_11440 [Sphingobacteriales bacterium 41-5]|nr:MAG: hypothetical protein BGN92_11440 [Sphingobacteriales bacterium 41-5]
MKERIWLVSEVFYPDTDIASGNIATEIARKFSEIYEVHVICGPKDYGVKTGNITDHLGEGIVFHRWKYFNFDKNHSLKRLIRVIGVSFGLFILGFKIKKGEKAFVISNPAFITPLYAFLKFFKDFRYILLMHDVFPENLIAGEYTKESSLVYKTIKKLFIRSRTSAEKIIVIGRDMKALLLKGFPLYRHDDIQVIPNWADVENVVPEPFSGNEIIRKLHLEDKIVTLFAGNHGILQNIRSFLSIIEKIENPVLHFVFAGGGSEKPVLEKYASEKRLNNVSFIPAFPRKDLNKMMNACHIGLVSLSDRLYGVGVPSKSYNILGAEKPILFLGNKNTEIPQFILENGMGWAFSYAEAAAIIDFFNHLNVTSLVEVTEKGKKGREIVVSQCSKERVLEKLTKFVSGI